MAIYFFSFIKSRISASNFSSAEGSGAGVGAGFSCFLLANLLMPFTKRNTQNAMMTKSMRFWMKLP